MPEPDTDARGWAATKTLSMGAAAPSTSPNAANGSAELAAVVDAADDGATVLGTGGRPPKKSSSPMSCVVAGAHGGGGGTAGRGVAAAQVAAGSVDRGGDEGFVAVAACGKLDGGRFI
eukprot:362154-Chlamydomonas_euryale.AAC.9